MMNDQTIHTSIAREELLRRASLAEFHRLRSERHQERKQRARNRIAKQTRKAEAADKLGPELDGCLTETVIVSAVMRLIETTETLTDAGEVVEAETICELAFTVALRRVWAVASGKPATTANAATVPQKLLSRGLIDKGTHEHLQQAVKGNLPLGARVCCLRGLLGLVSGRDCEKQQPDDCQQGDLSELLGSVPEKPAIILGARVKLVARLKPIG